MRTVPHCIYGGEAEEITAISLYKTEPEILTSDSVSFVCQLQSFPLPPLSVPMTKAPVSVWRRKTLLQGCFDYKPMAIATIPVNNPRTIRFLIFSSIKFLCSAKGAGKHLTIVLNAASNLLHFFFCEFIHFGILSVYKSTAPMALCAAFYVHRIVIK